MTPSPVCIVCCYLLLADQQPKADVGLVCSHPTPPLPSPCQYVLIPGAKPRYRPPPIAKAKQPEKDSSKKDAAVAPPTQNFFAFPSPAAKEPAAGAAKSTAFALPTTKHASAAPPATDAAADKQPVNFFSWSKPAAEGSAAATATAPASSLLNFPSASTTAAGAAAAPTCKIFGFGASQSEPAAETAPAATGSPLFKFPVVSSNADTTSQAATTAAATTAPMFSFSSAPAAGAGAGASFFGGAFQPAAAQEAGEAIVPGCGPVLHRVARFLPASWLLPFRLLGNCSALGPSPSLLSHTQGCRFGACVHAVWSIPTQHLTLTPNPNVESF